MINDASRSSEFAKGLERVAFYVYDAGGREALYLSSGSYRDSNELRNAIVKLYNTILKFLLSAKVFYEAKSGSKFDQLSINSMTAFCEIELTLLL